MQKAKPKVTGPKLNPLDPEFVKRQEQFLSQARLHHKLQPYLINIKSNAVNQVAEKKKEQKSFVDLILMVLQNKPNSKEIVEYIERVIFQQSCWNKESLQPLAENFIKAPEPKIQDDILMEIFKRANTCAIKTMEILLAEPNKKSGEESNIAVKYPDVYTKLKDAEQALTLNMEGYISQKLLKELINKIIEIEYNQVSQDKKFNVAKELAAMTFNPNKRDIVIDTDTSSEKKGKQSESSSPAKKLLALFSGSKKIEETGSKKVEENRSPTTSSPSTPRRPSLFNRSPTSPNVDELNKAVKKRSNTIIGMSGKKGAP